MADETFTLEDGASALIVRADGSHEILMPPGADDEDAPDSALQICLAMLALHDERVRNVAMAVFQEQRASLPTGVSHG